MRLLLSLAACVAVAAILSGCGGGKKTSSAPTTTVSQAANTAYERANSECSTVKPLDLAHKYNVKKDKAKIAVAVGKYWAQRAGGGSDAEELGREGCLDGFKFAGQ